MKNFPTTHEEARDIIDAEGKRDLFMETFNQALDVGSDPIIDYFVCYSNDPGVWFNVFNDLQIEFEQPTNESLLILVNQAVKACDWNKVVKLAEIGVEFGLGLTAWKE